MPQCDPLGHFEQLVMLAILRQDAPPSGAEIARCLEDNLERDVSRGTLYTTLDRLETKGFLRWKIEEGSKERGRHPRRAYRTPASGRAALRLPSPPLQGWGGGLEEALLRGRAGPFPLPMRF